MKSRLLKVFLALVVLLGLGVAFLPALVSSSGVRGVVLKRINRTFPGTVSIDDWSITWTRGIRMDGIQVDDPGSGVALSVAGVSVSNGVWAVARDWTQLGRITIREPVVRLVTPEPGAEPAPGRPGAGPGAEASRAPGKPGPAAEGGPTVLPDVSVDLSVEDGRVEIVAADGSSAQHLDAVSLRVRAPGGRQPVEFALACTVREGGDIAVEGTTTLTGEDGVLDPAAIVTDLRAHIRALDLEPLTAWLAGRAGTVPVVSGRLSAELSASGGAAAGLNVQGSVSLPDTRLSGEILQGDTPAIGDLDLELDARVADEAVTVRTLRLTGSAVAVSVEGAVSPAGASQLSVTGSVDVARWAGWLPNTLGLRDGVSIEDARVDLRASVRTEGDATVFDAALSADRIRARRDEQVIAWDEPTRIAASGRQAGGDIRIDALEVASPVLSATGSGTLDAMEIQLTARVGQALEEIGGVIDLGGWGGSGDLQVDASMSAGDEGRSLRLSVVSDRLAVSKAGEGVLPGGPVRIDLAGVYRAAEGDAPARVIRPSATWQTGLSAGRATLSEVELLPGRPLPVLREAAASFRIDLGALAGALRAVDALDESIRLAGTGAFELRGGADGERLSLEQASVTLKDLVAGTPGRELREETLTVSGTGEVDPGAGAAEIASLVLEASPGRVELRDATLSGEGAEATLEAQVDLGRLLDTVSDWVPLPEGTTVTGRSEWNARARLGTGSFAGAGSGTLTGLEIRTGEGDPIREERVEIAFDLEQDREAGALDVRTATIQAEALRLDARASTVVADTERRLAVEGDLGIDLARVAAFARALLGMDLVMEGRSDQPFRFESAWTVGEPNGMMRNGSMNAEVTADRIEAFGLTLTGFDIPARLADGVLALEVTGTVNDGQMEAHPRIDFNQDPPVASLHDPTNLLTNVALTDELSEGLLAKIHPLFAGASAVTGRLSMGMDEFVWPLDPAARAQARFNGRMAFTDLSMATHGLLEKILAAMKVRERNTTFGERDFEFRCENERISCSPLKFEVADHDVQLVGAMGLDQTLDYTVEVPVTQDMVGRSVYPYLEGATIHIPLRGTASRPDLTVSVLSDTVADLVKQAAQKAVEDNVGKLLEGLLSK